MTDTAPVGDNYRVLPEQPDLSARSRSMRKACSLVLAFAIAVLGVSSSVSAQIDKVQVGGIQGTAKDAQQANLSGVRVQVRDKDGKLAATGLTNAAGEFSFAGLAPGTYTVEVLDMAGNIVGIAPVTVVPGGTAKVTISAAAAGAIKAGSGGGLSLFGLGTIGTVAVIGGAAAVTTAAVVAVRDGKIVICHKVAGANSQTLEVAESARESHQAHGDTLGACPASPSR